MDDQLAAVIQAAVERRVVEPESSLKGTSVRLIALNADQGPYYEKVRLFQRLVEERFGVILRVVGGGYGCVNIRFVGDSQKGEAFFLNLFRSADFKQLASQVDFDLEIIEPRYERLDIRGLAATDATVEGAVDFAILTALFEPEFVALRDRLKMASGNNERLVQNGNTLDMLYEIGIESRSPTRPLRVVATYLPRMGNVSAAVTTTRLLQRWRPSKLFLVGIAGALGSGKLGLGDVILGEEVLHYDAQRKEEESGTVWAPVSYHPDEALLQAAQRLTLDDTFMHSWRGDLGRESARGTRFPELVIGEIASGDAVVDSAPFVKKIKSLNRKLIAVEMEAAGVLEAARQANFESNTLVIRGICDLANGTKDDSWQHYASRAASSFAVRFAHRLSSDTYSQSLISTTQLRDSSPHVAPAETKKH